MSTQTGDDREGTRIDGRHRVNASEWSHLGTWVRVKSSTVAALAYDIDEKVLSVEFKNSKGGPSSIYTYDNVPEKVAMALFNASSVGSFHAKNIKGKYDYHKVR